MADSTLTTMAAATALADADETYIEQGGVAKKATPLVARDYYGRRTVTAAITAHVGSSQGDGALTANVNQISVCANAGDAVTLPAADAAGGFECTIINDGAQACDVFPASGDDCGGGVDTAVSLAAGANITYVSYDATNWVALS